MLTPQLLQRATGCTSARADLYCGPLLNAALAFGVTTPRRLAAFLAQVGHESESFRWMKEVWGPTDAQKRYEGRKDLGNTELGDGERYMGRGPIQITGRFNYRKATRDLREVLGDTVPDFEAEPERLEDPHWGFMAAANFWQKAGCNELADTGQFETMTRRINGGLNGYEDRKRRWELAKSVLPDNPGTPQPKEPEVPIPPIVAMLGASLIEAFAPLAKEKIQKEIGRHTKSPEVAEQVAEAVVETVKTATGKSDPIEAVAEARKDPTIIQRAEESALAKLEQMAPFLEKLHALERQEYLDEEASREAAAKRTAAEPWDMTRTLVYGALGMIGVLMLFIGTVAAIQAYKGDIKPEVWAQIAGLVGFITGVGTTLFTYRFGSSRSSAAKDLLITNLSKASK